MSLERLRTDTVDPIDASFRPKKNHYYGTSGDDTFVGDARTASYFHLANGGDDTVSITRGYAVAYFGEAFDANDRIDSASGGGVIYLNGDYAFDVADLTRLSGKFAWNLEGAHRYDLTLDYNSGVTVTSATSVTIDAREAGGSFRLGTVSGPTIGDATITGGDSYDFFYLNIRQDSGAIVLDGGDGIDKFVVSSSQSNPTIQLDGKAHQIGSGSLQLIGIEDVDGGSRNDTIIGNGERNELNGNDGDDVLNGGGGDDVLLGLFGDDVLNGGKGDDLLFSSNQFTGDHDVLRGGRGDDTLVAGLGVQTMYGGLGDDTFSFERLERSRDLGDIIADFTSGDTIDLSHIDTDLSTPGVDDAFHLGATPQHVGDLLISYDAANDRTVLSAYLDEDDVADAFVYLPGQMTLTAADFEL